MAVDGWAKAVRQQVGLGSVLPLGGPRDGAWITERAAAPVLRRAAGFTGGARPGRPRISPVDPGASHDPVVPPPPSAVPPGPLRIDPDFPASADPTAPAAEPLWATAARPRASPATAATERLGLTVTEVDPRVMGSLDADDASAAAPDDGCPAEEPAPGPTRDGEEFRPAAAALSVPGVTRLTGVLGGPARAVNIEIGSEAAEGDGVADAGFTAERARAVLAAATPHGADDAARARLLALGENAVFALGDRGPRGPGRPQTSPNSGSGPARELRRGASGWPAEGVPAVRPDAPLRRRVSEPLAYDGHPGHLLAAAPAGGRPAAPGRRDLAALLQAGARPAPPPRLTLPPRELLGGVDRWLRLAGDAIDPADAAYLRERRDGFATAAAALTPHLPPGPIHGDALPRNVHIGPDGPVLVDLETFSADLREHDLVVMALSHDRYGLVPTASYDAFTEAYGWDVREWEGCGVLRGARETASCAWVAQHAPVNPKALAEFSRRVGSLREGDSTVRWYPF